MKQTEIIKRLIKRVYISHLLKRDKLKRANLPERFNGLKPELWGCKINNVGHLSLQDVDVITLAEDYGTPLYIVDKKQLLKNYTNFVGSFRAHISNIILGTSYKTNPLPGVLSLLHQAGTWAEVISHFELWLALTLGVSPEKIVVNGPGKGRDCIELAVSRGVRLINIDGIEEISWISEAARKKGVRQDVGLRLITSFGWKGQFGTSIATGESFQVFQELKRHPELNPCGLHLHLGTGLKDVTAYLDAVGEVIRFAQQLDRELGIHITVFDFGGGFGVPTVRSPDAWDLRMPEFGYAHRMPIPEESPSFEKYAKGIAGKFKHLQYEFSEKAPLVILEPGRAITSSAQMLLLRIVTVKQAKGVRKKLILDGGKNITLPLGYEIHQIFPANKMTAENTDLFDIYGPLCHPGDIIERCKALPQLDTGDFIAIMDAGAYFIPNQTNFSNPRPPVVLISENKVTEIRSRESFSDIIRLDNFNGRIDIQ